MTGAIGLSFFNSFPTPLSSPLEGLKSGDPTALIPGLKQHCADHIPLYLALLNKPALKRDVKACERFAEALFYASLRVLPEVVEKLLQFPMTLPARLNPEDLLFVCDADPATSYTTIEDNIDVNQFGLEEAIYAAVLEGHAQDKLPEAEQIVRLVLERIVSVYESVNDNERRDYCLNNSGPSECEASYLDKSLEYAQRVNLDAIVAVLKPYVENYGISPDKDIVNRLELLLTKLNDRQQLCKLSADLIAMLGAKRYRYLDREIHTQALFFAITHQLTDLVEVLLDHPQFDLGKMQHGEIVQLFSHALTHLSVPVVEHLSENLEDFETVIISHQNSESQSPIVTCLQGYLEHRKLPYCANPRPILRILFELDREMNEQLADAEEIEMKIRVLREEMSNRQYSFDSAVMNVIDEYLTFDSDQSDIEGSDETGSAVCLAGDSDNDV